MESYYPNFGLFGQDLSVTNSDSRHSYLFIVYSFMVGRTCSTINDKDEGGECLYEAAGWSGRCHQAFGNGPAATVTRL
jgi:hypothetical protein